LRTLPNRERTSSIAAVPSGMRIKEVLPAGKDRLVLVSDGGVTVLDTRAGTLRPFLARSQVLDVSAVRAGEDGLEVTALEPGRQDEVDVWLRQPAADFLAAFHGDPDLPNLLPAGWTALDLLFLDPRDVALLDQMSGRIVLEILGKRRRRWALDLAFDKDGINAGRARATVQIDGASYDGLRTRTIAPMQALLGGKVKIDGDRTLAMKALMLTAQRLARAI